jgi:sugar-specific transcriptional regulator TrmB
MLPTLLQKFGLSEKEAGLYLILLRYGSQPTSAIAKRALMNRGTAFLTLKELVRKGLATKSLKGDVQYHAPVSPRYLNSLLERKKEAVSDLEKELKEALPLLTTLQSPSSPHPKISFFEGREGIRALPEDTLSTSDKKLCGILSMADLYEVFGEEYFEQYVERRIKNGLSLRVMRNKIKDIKERWPSSKKDNRELRYLPSNMVFPATMYIYDGKVSFISSEKEDFGVLIESREIYQIQKHLFEALWEKVDT